MDIEAIIKKDIDPQWFNYIDAELLTECCNKIAADLLGKGVDITKSIDKYIQPNLQHVLRCLKYFKPGELRCIIIGQDPYPTPGHANGLAFSNKHTMPKSVNRIFGAMKHCGIITAMPATGDLEYLAKQGVMLLNSMLTRTLLIKSGKIIGNGSRDNRTYHKFWHLFVTDFIENLTKLPQPIVVMAWGGKARAVIDFVEFPDNFRLMKWCHPVAMTSPSFKLCPHFIDCNEFIDKPIAWDPSHVPQLPSILVYTDGGCVDNGKANAVATWACYFPDFDIVEISGKVPPHRLALKNNRIRCYRAAMQPTNNRGEWLAVIMALIHIRKISDMRNVTIVTDSNYIKGVLTGWLMNWKINNEIDNKKNSDLSKITLVLLEEFNITVIHQRSHTKGGGEHVSGNARADALCNAAFKYSDYKTQIVYK